MSFHVCSDKLMGKSLNAKRLVVGQSLGGLVDWLVHWFDQVWGGKNEGELETVSCLQWYRQMKTGM